MSPAVLPLGAARNAGVQRGGKSTRWMPLVRRQRPEETAGSSYWSSMSIRDRTGVVEGPVDDQCGAKSTQWLPRPPTPRRYSQADDRCGGNQHMDTSRSCVSKTSCSIIIS